MINFNTNGGKFNFRVAGLIFDNNRLLIHRLKTDNFFALPGGRVEFMENTEATLIREMKEELNIDVEIEQLLWIGEHFYEYSNTQYHEICYYYLLKTDDKTLNTTNNTFEIVEENRSYEFKWLPLHDLQNETFYPLFIKKRINALPERIEKFVEIGDDFYEKWFRN